jgi:nicotinate phosphoribosyltransferase
MERKWRIASEEEILSGDTTDIYFDRTAKILQAEGIDPIVHAEVTVSSMPKDTPWGIVAGINDVLNLFEDRKVTVRGLPEGTIFYPTDASGVRTPVLSIEGHYSEFVTLETAMLGFICHASGLVTRTAKIRKAAGNKTLLSFGARRTHPAIAPQVEYAAYIGGCDGVSSVLGAEMLDLAPSGTMPHSLVIIFKDLTKALVAFDHNTQKGIPRIAIADTYSDEVAEAVQAARSIENLTGIRLDTTGSRRGDFQRIIEEVRWELDVRGFQNIKIYASGGLGIRELRELSDSPVDGYGVGGAISNAPTIDFAMDIVSMKESGVWKPVAKRGKFSGRKEAWQCPNCMVTHVTLQGQDAPICRNCNQLTQKVTVGMIEEGKKINLYQEPSEIRQRVLEQISKVADVE